VQRIRRNDFGAELEIKTRKVASTMANGDNSEAEEVLTTEEEREAFHIVRAILSKHVQPSRVVMRDTKSSSGVLWDDNNRKPICHLRFNYSQKYLGLFDAEKNEEKFALNVPLDVFKFEDRLIAALSFYEPKQNESAANA
jgi:predicted type IV restriction endonuclease